MLKYFLSEMTSEGYIYSCDKICIKGKLNFFEVSTFTRSLSDFLYFNYCSEISDCISLPWSPKGLLEYKHAERYGIGDYRYNLNMVLTDNSSFYFGYLHNSQKNGIVYWKIEMNPNKIMPCAFVSSFISFVYSCSVFSSIKISQLDIAFDFPLDRSSFYLEKDKRISTIVNDGNNNITEYLSKHNSNGFCKLYNKTIESHLDYVLTRFEITLKDNFYYSSLCSVLPKLHIYDKSQINFSEIPVELSQNDAVFVDLLRLHPDFKKRLTFRKQLKFSPYLDFQAPLFVVDRVLYDHLIFKIKEVFLFG